MSVSPLQGPTWSGVTYPTGDGTQNEFKRVIRGSANIQHCDTQIEGNGVTTLWKTGDKPQENQDAKAGRAIGYGELSVKWETASGQCSYVLRRCGGRSLLAARSCSVKLDSESALGFRRSRHHRGRRDDA